MPKSQFLLVLTVVSSVWMPGILQTAAAAERIFINTPAMTVELSAVRSTEELGALQEQYSKAVSITVGKVLELHVPVGYTVFPHAEIDLGRTIFFDKSRNWSIALPNALNNIGVEMTLDAKHKTIRLAPKKATQLVSAK